VGAIVVVIAGVLSWRLTDLQLRHPERYVEFGQSQRTETIAIPGARGDVRDRNGQLLATSLDQAAVWADPRFVADPVSEAALLAPVLGLDPEELAGDLAADSRFVYLSRQVPDDIVAQVEALELDGIYTWPEPKRFNPAGESLAGSVVGQVGVDNVGLSGVELAFDEILRGAAGELSFERDAQGRAIPVAPSDLEPAHRGADVHLTIDGSLQFEAEQVLLSQVEEMDAAGGVVVITVPSTGEILAIVNVERDAETGEPVVSNENRAITWAYEPGSVMKALTFAGVLDSGIANPDSVKDVPDSIVLYDDTFSDHSGHPIEEWTVSDIVTRSSNVGSILWAQELGGARLDDYLRRFGLGAPTGIGLPGETPGIVLPLDQWSGTTIGTVPIGQGISVTPLQMLAGLNAIANGGVYVAPTIVSAVVEADGTRHQPAVDEGRRVVSEAAAAQMRTILTRVVDDGTGQLAAVEGYAVAGKTGTAWKPLPEGGYEDGAGNFRYVTTFAGFLPAEDPQISIIVVIDEPSASIYASFASAPPFAELARYTLRHLRIPPPGGVVADIPTPEPVADPAPDALAVGIVEGPATDGEFEEAAGAGP
jgi:cell division protein FtsI (penicillin-binding protein 3)